MRPSSLIGWGAAGCAVALAPALWLWKYQNPFAPSLANPDHIANWLVFGGIIVGYATFVVSSTLQSRMTAAQNTLSALQSLRTDKDYLSHAKTFKDRVGRLDVPMHNDLFDVLLAADRSGPISALNPGPAAADRDFAQAVDFILNQYEFIAAGVHLGIMDERFLRKTIRSTITGLAITLQSYIRQQRTDNRARWENFVRLHRRFAKGTAEAGLDLGPPPGR